MSLELSKDTVYLCLTGKKTTRNMSTIFEKLKVGIQPTTVKTDPKTLRSDMQLLKADNLTWQDAARYCQAAAEAEQKQMRVSRTFPCLPWAGAYSLERIMKTLYTETPTSSNQTIMIDTNKGSVPIRWGQFNVAGVGIVSQDIVISNDVGVGYVVNVECVRRNEAKAQEFLEKVGELIWSNEIYSGCALRMDTDEDGNIDVFSPPKVIDLMSHPRQVEHLVLNDHLMDRVREEILLNITKNDGEMVRRGIILSGLPGTGKTLTASITATVAIQNGWTVLYLNDMRALRACLLLAKSFKKTVLVVEDIETQLKRDAEGNKVLNIVDGLDREAQVMLIGTTNNLPRLPAAMLRAGRSHSIIEFELPDAKSATSLLQKNLGEAWHPMLESEIGPSCANLLPASIEEVARRVILHLKARNRKALNDGDLPKLRRVVLDARHHNKLVMDAETRDYAPKIPTVRVITDGTLDARTASSYVATSYAEEPA